MYKMRNRNDRYITICKWTLETKCAACALCSFQLAITIVSLAQHIFSFIMYSKIFNCQFNVTANSPNAVSTFLQADFVIYDFGLFFNMWSIKECIAVRMDGGYLRALWCLGYIGAAGLTFLAAILKQPHPVLLYPILSMQSTFCIGVLILSFSALPKLLKAILLDMDGKMFCLIAAFLSGCTINYVLTYMLWRFHWYVEQLSKLRSTADQAAAALQHGNPNMGKHLAPSAPDRTKLVATAAKETSSPKSIRMKTLTIPQQMA